MFEHLLSCGEPSCHVCGDDIYQCPHNASICAPPAKLSPQPIAISRWDHPEEWLRQYLARERPPVTHGWDGLDDERPGMIIKDELVQP